MRNTILLLHAIPEIRSQLRALVGESYYVLETGDIATFRRLLEDKQNAVAGVFLAYNFLSVASKDGLMRDGNPYLPADIPVFAITEENRQDLEGKAVQWGADQILHLPLEQAATGILIRKLIRLYTKNRNMVKILEEQKDALSNTGEVLIDALSTIIECRSVESGQHVLRIRSFTRVLLREVERFCPEYGLDDVVISQISGAAALHDIGKISIPDAILNKPGKLPEDEFAIMKTHSAAGSEIIARLGGMGNENFLRYAYNICRYHHERWDGRGYPEGLSGEDIPLCAQVVGLTDAYDALTTKRVYKEACSCEQATNMILNGECGVFSPKLLECFKQVQEEFSYLAKRYADGGISPAERIVEPLTPPSRSVTNALQDVMHKYDILLQHIGALVMEVDLETNIIQTIYNPDHSFDYLQNAKNPAHAMNLLAENSVHPDDRVLLTDRFNEYLEMFFDSGLNKSVRRYRMQDMHGVYRYYDVSCYRLEEGTKKILGVWEEAPEDKNRLERDSLTDLLNKESACRQTEEFLMEKTEGRLFGLAIVDLDNFKLVNDRYGHLFGDELLSLVAQKLRRLFRSTDVVARIGGDEFLIFMPNIPDRAVIVERCQMLIREIADMFDGKMQEVGLSCSVGIAYAPEHGANYQDLFRRADIALYRAKHLGKNCHVVYDPLLQMQAHPSQVSQRIDSDEQPEWTENNLPYYAFDMLYESGNVEATINHLLAIIGQQTNASRVYIFENSRDDTTCSNTFEWCNEGVTAEIDNLQEISYITDIPGYEKNFNELGIFYCSDVATLPLHLRNILEPQGIRSLLHCAIRDNGRFRGYVGLDDNNNPRMWTQEQIDAITFLSRIVSIFLMKHRVQEETHTMAENLRQVLNHEYAWVYIVEPETYRIKFLNERTEHLVPGISKDSICYKVLMNRDEPCEDCPIRTKKQMFINNQHLGKQVLVDASKIRWEGKNQWLITCREDENKKIIKNKK